MDGCSEPDGQSKTVDRRGPYEPSRAYFARLQVKGKLIRRRAALKSFRICETEKMNHG
jgi:hypothetical protein